MTASMATPTPPPGLPSATYGVRGLQSLRRQRSAHGASTAKVPVESRRAETHRTRVTSYFLEHVDPIMAACITNLLLTQPEERDVPEALVTYLLARKTDPEADTKVNIRPSSKPEQKQYLVNIIGPVVSKLIKRIATEQPSDVSAFIVSELGGQHHADLHQSPPTSTSTHQPEDGADEQYSGMVHKVDVKDAVALSSKDESQLPHVPLPTEADNSQELPAPAVLEPRTISILLIGLDGSGKTTMVNALQGDFSSKIRPTVGFRPVTMALNEDTTVKFYDLGGGPRIRDIWAQYYHDAHAVVFMVDSSSSAERMEEARRVFQACRESPYLSGKPLLTLASKQDAEGAVSPDEVAAFLGLGDQPSVSTAGCSVAPDAAVGEATVDSRIESGLSWLLNEVQIQFGTLQARVASDTLQMTQMELRKRLERERKVLKSKIASAFHSMLSAELADTVEPSKPDEIFTEQEGIEFLSSEIGVAVVDMADTAIELTKLVGQQRLALSIIGGLFCPVSKKKPPMTWDQIRELIVEVRAELGLL